MILEAYLKQNNVCSSQFLLNSNFSEMVSEHISEPDISQWNIEFISAVAKIVGKDKVFVKEELQKLEKNISKISPENLSHFEGKFKLENRRYIGNKNKLMKWISSLLIEHTRGDSFFDVFAGTGVVSKSMISNYKRIILNDFLHSNNIIFKAFFSTQSYDANKLLKFRDFFNNIRTNRADDEYFVNNYGGKFFSEHDSRIIGEIRTRIENAKNLNQREHSILLASLIYSLDKIANTVGHYDAYRKKIIIQNKFKFDLIRPLDVSNKIIEIYKEDSNELVNRIKTDVAFIDPPYNSRQYSRFYHVLENIVKWSKPELTGAAMKPPADNMSEYSRTLAPLVFDKLIQDLNARYIVVTYNNTYNSKSSSSKNKITHGQILGSLNKVGNTQTFEMPFKFFNAGKADFKDHKEYVFITKVKN